MHRAFQLPHQGGALVALGHQLYVGVVDAVHQPNVIHIAADSDMGEFPAGKLLEGHSGLPVNAHILDDVALRIQQKAAAVADNGTVKSYLLHHHLHTAGGAGGAEDDGDSLLLQMMQQQFGVLGNLVLGIYQGSVNIQQDDGIGIHGFTPGV